MLKFNLRWDDSFPKGSVEDITSGKCTATIATKKVWNDIPSFWIDFLENLILSWDSIFTEPMLKKNASEVDKLEFELNHDLSKGVKGKVIPSIILYRCGNDFEILIGEEKFKASFTEISRNLTAIGDYIALRLKNSKDVRAKTALEKWNKKKVYRYG